MPSWQQVKQGARRLGLGTLALVSFAAPFAVSLAANITAGLHSGSEVLLVAGVAIPVLLMLAIELWRRLPALDPARTWARFFRGLAMAAPVTVAAGWSWMDTTGLLLAQYPSEGPGSPSVVQWWLCFTAPLAVDGLAVLAVLARGVGATPAPVEAAHPPTEEPQPWGGPDTVTAPTPPQTPTRPSTPREPTPLRSVPATPARPRPSRQPRTATAHVAGWRADMAAVSRVEAPDETRWLRMRAKAVGVSQSRKSNTTLRHDVETAELARAREAVSA